MARNLNSEITSPNAAMEIISQLTLAVRRSPTTVARSIATTLCEPAGKLDESIEIGTRGLDTIAHTAKEAGRKLTSAGRLAYDLALLGDALMGIVLDRDDLGDVTNNRLAEYAAGFFLQASQAVQFAPTDDWARLATIRVLTRHQSNTPA